MPSSDDSRDGGASDRWFVTNGIVALGPVSFELVLRGLAYGRIPAGSFVRHQSWQVWRRLEDLESQSAGNRRQIVEELGQRSAAIEKAAPIDSSQPPSSSPAELKSRTD